MFSSPSSHHLSPSHQKASLYSTLSELETAESTLPWTGGEITPEGYQDALGHRGAPLGL